MKSPAAITFNKNKDKKVNFIPFDEDVPMGLSGCITNSTCESAHSKNKAIPIVMAPTMRFDFTHSLEIKIPEVKIKTNALYL